MPRLSMWRPEKSNDYKFLDNIIREQYTAGGLDIHIHKYLGPKTTAEPSGDATQPTYDETNPLFIEDILLLENRNREYEDDVYTMRGVYQAQDIDFDLSQFGLFLQNDTLFITFHYNDMIDHVGRKLMNGDVLEIPNLRDYHPLDDTVPKALPKFYVINDANFASEGFSQTWLPHIWRVKAVPLVASQEYNDILDQYANTTGGINCGDDGAGNGDGTLRDYMSQCSKNQELNDAILAQAEVEVPLSGYDISSFYILEYDENGEPANSYGLPVDTTAYTADDNITTADSAIRIDSSLSADTTTITVDVGIVSFDPSNSTPTGGELTLGYLDGDGLAPNGWSVIPGTAFPVAPEEGQYVLRLDYKPNRLFRYDGTTWIKVEDSVRTDIYMNGETQRAEFFNNEDTVSTTDRGDVPSRQSLSDLLKPDADN